jgi:uncharacterized protein (DUF433 family)
MKTLYERNDFEQKKLMHAYFNRANRILDEKERLARTRATQATIDIVINQNGEHTELYIPVKHGQQGPLMSLVQEHCKDKFDSKAEVGEYKNYVVLRTGKTVNPETLAEKLNKNQPGRFTRYNITLAPAANFRFASEAQYLGAPEQKTEQPAQKPITRAIKHTAGIPSNDILQIKNYLKQGMSIEDIAKKQDKYDIGQLRSIAKHIKIGTYEKPMQDMTPELEQKVFKAVKDGKTNQEIAKMYNLNTFQVVARRAKYTRLKNIGKVK